MSIIADCCAGNTRSRVTDQGSAYATLAEMLRADSGEGKAARGESEDQLLQISLEIIDTSATSLEHLIRFRESEQTSRGLAYQELRHRYVDGLEKYVRELAKNSGHASDAEIQRNFRNDMKIDLENLRSELWN